MASMIDSSWKSLYKSGGIGFLLSGAFAILHVVAQLIIYLQMVSYNPKNLQDLLTFALTRTNLFYAEYYSIGLWMLFTLPGVMALYFVFSHRDKGLALIGSALGLLGVGMFLSNLADHIFFVQEAITYSGGCTVCATSALSGAAGTFSADTADAIAGFALGAGIIFFSVLMLAGHSFAKPIGGLGAVAGLMLAGIYPLVTFIAGSDVVFYASAISTALVAVWLFAVGVKLYKIA